MKKRGRPAGLTETTRKIILLAARDIFKQLGLRKASVDDICQKAEVSRMTFYRYYPDKVEVAMAILNSENQAIEEKLDQVLTGHSSFIEKFEVLRQMNLEFLKNLGERFLNDVFTTETDPRIREFYEGIKKSRKSRIDQFFLQGQKEGFLNPRLPLSFLHVLLQAIDEIYFKEQTLETFPNPGDRSEILSEFFFYGAMGKK